MYPVSDQCTRLCTGPSSPWPRLAMETLPQLPGLENWWDQARAKIISFKPRCNFFISACAICGVLCISLPIPIIVNNFNKFYEKAKIEEEILAKKKRTSWEEAKRGNIIITILLFQNTLVFRNISEHSWLLWWNRFEDTEQYVQKVSNQARQVFLPYL